MKMKSLKWDELIQVLKPTYIYLKLTPDTSIRNYNSTNIAKSINLMHKKVSDRIRREQKKLIIETPIKCSYLIDIRKNSVDFYLIVPKQYVSIAQEKIREIWPKCTITQEQSISEFSQNALKYQLYYKKEDALSLNVDKKTNEPLNAVLNVVDIMEESDRVGIYYNFIPTSQVGWKKQYKDTIDKLNSGMPIDREKLNVKYIGKMGFAYLIDFLDSILEVINDFAGGKKKKSNGDLNLLSLALDTIHNAKELSAATKKKKDNTILNTQIAILSDSNDRTRRQNSALAICQAYKTIEEDNELIYKRLNKSFGFNDADIGTEINKTSIDECQNFIQLPGRDLLQQHKVIQKIDTLESPVPTDLQKGTKLINKVPYKGSSQNAYLTTDKDYKNLAVVVVGPTRSGKTSFLGNLARNSVDAGECVIVPDYIENCQLAADIAEFFKPEQKIDIDLSDLHNLPAFNYCEAVTENQDPLYIYDNLKRQANLLSYLINSVNVENKELAPRMNRYLEAAAHIVYSQGGPTIDILHVLEEHEIRMNYLNNVPSMLKEYLSGSITDLEQLNERSKATKDRPAEITGTHITYVSGILDRFYILKKNTAMEIMMSKKPDNSMNLTSEIQKGQLITIKMPESVFPTEDERDIMVTYWVTKIYLAGQVRADRIRDKYARTTVNVITDEIAQLESAEKFIGSRLDKTAKFGIKFILSTMYINQLRIREKLRTANTSYILIAGSDKVNYTELKDELSQHGYALEDLMNLKRFQSLNYIKYEQGYAAFIGWLPKPLI